MKKILLSFLLLIPALAYTQDKTLDSLTQLLNNHPQRDTARVGILLKIGNHLLSSSDKSKEHIEEAMNIAAELKFEKGMAEASNHLAHYYWYRADFPQAIEQALRTLNLYEGLRDTYGLFDANLTLSGVYMSWQDFEKAEAHMAKVLELAELHRDKVDFGGLYEKVAFLKLYQDQVDEGILYLNKSLAIHEERKDLYGQAGCYFLLAKARQMRGDYAATLQSYQRQVQLLKKSGHHHALADIGASHEGIGEVYVTLKKYDKASLHLDTAFQIAQQVKSVNTMMRVYRNLASLHEASGNFREALRYERMHHMLSDSTINATKSQQFAEAQAKYETEKKEHEIVLLEQKSQVQALWRNSLSGGLLITIVASALIYSLQRSRARKTKLLLETQQLLVQQMQQAEKVKSRFFANISHEFRTPLTLILTPVEEKLLTNDLPHRDRVSFQTIRRSANRLLELINQVLELSKLESGAMKIQLQPGNLNNFIAPILSTFDSMADVSQVTYVREVKIPETVVLLDGDKLEKIFNNLLSNAFKFSPRGGHVNARITAVEAEKSLELHIEIRNAGSLIPKDMLEKIFEPFVQADTPTAQRMPGTGLGLSMVKELIKLLGGSIAVASNPHDGTVFRVRLPFEKTDSSAEARLTEKIQSIEAVDEIAGDEQQEETEDMKDTILIVEDNAEVRALIRQGLVASYRVVEASDGKEGIRMAREHPVSLVVSDVMMPQMSGAELCHQLKHDELTSHIPVILLTARADHESKLEGLRTGADDYMVKPFNLQELQARIVNLLDQRKRLAMRFSRRIAVQPHDITVTPLDERFIEKCIRMVEDHMDDPELNVNAMTKSLGISRTHLQRKLKSITGLAANEFIQDLRLKRAAVLIEKNADTIAQIAYQVGFNDQSYFTKCFRKKFGKTPSDYASAVQSEIEKV